MRLLIITFYKLKMMFNDRLFFAAMIILPLFISIAAGYALRYEKLNLIPIAFVDEDASIYSGQLLQRLKEKEGLKQLILPRDEAFSMLDGNRVEQVFVIKEGFERKIKNGESKALIDVVASPSSYSADFTSEIVAGEAIRITTGELAALWVEEQYKRLGKDTGNALKEEVLEYNEKFWEPEPLLTVKYMEQQGGVIKTIKRISLPAAAATSIGLITAFLMFYILFSSGWLVEERTNGTLARLTSGSGALFISYAGSIFALMIAGVIQIILFYGINKLIFGVELLQGVFSFVIFFAYLLAVISISLCLSSILKTQAQLQAGAPFFALMTGFAGGCFWNFVEMPERIKFLSIFTPQGWVLDGIEKIVQEPMELSIVFPNFMVLFSIPLILLPLSYIIIVMRLKY